MTGLSNFVDLNTTSPVNQVVTRYAKNDGLRYGDYQGDPAGFISDVLGEKTLTNDQLRILDTLAKYDRIVVKSATGTGKSFLGARIATYFFKAYERAQIYMAAAPPESNLRRILWSELSEVFIKNPSVFEGEKISDLKIRRTTDPKSYIVGTTIPQNGTEDERKARFSGKHSPVLVFLLDEADAIPGEILEAIEGCMSGGSVTKLIMFMNPKKKGGYIYHELIRGKQAHVITMSAFNHVNVVTGEDVIPGAVTRKTVLQRINEWTYIPNEDEYKDVWDEWQESGNLKNGFFSIPDCLIGTTCQRTNGDGDYDPLPAGIRKVKPLYQKFFYMVLGEYPLDDAQQLIPTEAIEAARTRWDLWVAQYGENPPELVRPIMGLDVAEYGRDANSLCLRYGNWVPNFKKRNGIDPDTVALWASKIYKEVNCRSGKIDAIGIGSGIPSRMGRDGCNGVAGIKVNEKPSNKHSQDGEFGSLRDEIYWLMAKWVQNDSSMLPPNKTLVDSLLALQYEVNSKGKICIISKKQLKTKLGYSPDDLDSLALTFSPAKTSFFKI